jgi:hypothetical protein
MYVEGLLVIAETTHPSHSLGRAGNLQKSGAGEAKKPF